ncbi:MAG: hypothetical protein QOI66_1542, partial [Myxococcales bacterium]|nr:hypothetical protein [Myxococcales bacterium]
MAAATLAAGGCGSSGANAGDGATAADGTGGAGDDDFAKCVWEGTSSMATPGVSLTANNSADLTGALIGDLDADPASQRKMVAVQAEGLAEDLVLGDGYLSRLTASTESAYLVIPVTNTSARTLCSIKGTKYRWLDADGNPLAMPGASDTLYVGGSVQTLSNDDFTYNCLGAGEKGYFTDVKTTADGTMLYSKVATVAFGLNGPFTDGTPPEGQLIPTGYDVGACPDGKRAVKVTLSNGGTGDVALEPFSFSPAILLDDGGLPAGWLFLQRTERIVI